MASLRFVDIAALLGFAGEAVLYGVNVVVFALSMNIFQKRQRRYFSSTILLYLNLLLFLSCSTHFALEFAHFYITLTKTGVYQFADESCIYYGADIIISVTDFIGDVILIYRCWVIWERQYYVVVVPFLTSLGGLVCAGLVAELARGGTGSRVEKSVIPLGLASFTLPLCTNVIVTTLIISRICYLTRVMTKGATAPRSRQVVHIILESGALYALVQLVFVVLYAIQHPALQIVVPMAVQIYGIASIVVVVHAGFSVPQHYTTTAAADDAGVITSFSELLPNRTQSTYLSSSCGTPVTSRVRRHTMSFPFPRREVSELPEAGA